MKLDQDDVDRICRLVVDHDLDTQYVADRYDINRRRVQQLAKEYRETGTIPSIETPERKPCAEYPADLVDRVLELYELHRLLPTAEDAAQLAVADGNDDATK